jgi:hypothetical protein
VRDDETNGELGGQPSENKPAQEGRPTGSIRRQDAATARPRRPTVAEARQRDKAQKAREAAALFAEQQALKQEARAASRRKVMMGSVAVVGLVGVVALGYHVLNDDDEVSATCVRDGTNEVVDEQYCSTGSVGAGGIFIFAGSPYRYYYGGNNGGIGTTARGGTLELPRGTTGRTSAGQSISRGGGADSGSITRGGFGSSSNGGFGGSGS